MCQCWWIPDVRCSSMVRDVLTRKSSSSASNHQERASVSPSSTKRRGRGIAAWATRHHRRRSPDTDGTNLRNRRGYHARATASPSEVSNRHCARLTKQLPTPSDQAAEAQVRLVVLAHQERGGLRSWCAKTTQTGGHDQLQHLGTDLLISIAPDGMLLEQGLDRLVGVCVASHQGRPSPATFRSGVRWRRSDRSAVRTRSSGSARRRSSQAFGVCGC